jgi:hypothetical protein
MDHPHRLPVLGEAVMRIFLVGCIIGGSVTAAVIIVYYGTRLAVRHIGRILREGR